MKRTCFKGAVLHHLDVSSREAIVGALLDMRISSEQRKMIMRLNEHSLGHFGVLVGDYGTIVTYAGRIRGRTGSRTMAIALAKIVRKVTGAQPVLRQLRDRRMVIRALTAPVDD